MRALPSSVHVVFFQSLLCAMAPKKGALNPWRKFPPQLCIECKQDTHSYDRDAEGWEFLVWYKKGRPDKKGNCPPGGSSCAACFDVRRFYAEEKIPSAENMNEKRNKDSEFDAEWHSVRRSKVRKEPLAEQKAKRDKMRTVGKKKVFFQKRYREGIWQEIGDFVRSRKLGFTRDANLKDVFRLIAKKYPSYKIDRDPDTHEWGVKIYDLPSKSKRFQEGVNDESVREKWTTHEDEEELEHSHAANVHELLGGPGGKEDGESDAGEACGAPDDESERGPVSDDDSQDLGDEAAKHPGWDTRSEATTASSSNMKRKIGQTAIHSKAAPSSPKVTHAASDTGWKSTAATPKGKGDDVEDAVGGAPKSGKKEEDKTGDCNGRW